MSCFEDIWLERRFSTLRLQNKYNNYIPNMFSWSVNKTRKWYSCTCISNRTLSKQTLMWWFPRTFLKSTLTVSGRERTQLKLQVPGKAWHWLQVNSEWKSGSEWQNYTTNSNWEPTLNWKASDCRSPWLGLPNLRGWKPRSNLRNALKPKITKLKVKPYWMIKIDSINGSKHDIYTDYVNPTVWTE